MVHPAQQPEQEKRRWLQPLLLWLLTLCLWLPGLGNLPLRDWDEGRVASVARSTTTLLPMKWGQKYLNKPPGLHWPMGQMIRRVGAGEASVRLLPATFSSLAVPMILLLRRSLDEAKTERSENAALMAAVVLMTLLPMARHGRLAMLDGTLLSCSLVLWWGWLGNRHALWRSMLAGLACSGILLLKPPALIGFLPLAAVLGGRTHWPGVRSGGALLMGLLPGLGWHLWHWSVRGNDAWVMWGGQGLARVTSSVGDGHGWWTPWIELLEGGWPWLLLLPSGLYWAWRHRGSSAGRWELGLLIGTAAMVLPLRTQLPWYSHLLWPPIALICAEGLTDLLNRGQPRWVSWAWQGLGLALLILVVTFQFTPTAPDVPRNALLCGGLGLSLGAPLLRNPSGRWRQRGLLLLVVGWCLALLSLWHSKLWLWELNESWDPRPVAAEIRALPAEDPIWLKGPTRPALGWYAGRDVKRFRQTDPPTGEHWLVADRKPNGCELASKPVPGAWQLWHCP